MGVPLSGRSFRYIFFKRLHRPKKDAAAKANATINEQ